MEMVLAYGTLVTHILIGVGVLWLLVNRISGREFGAKVLHFFKRNSVTFAFLVSFTSAIGSLFYSEIIGLLPCTLCWYQRVFMFPLAILLAVAFWRDRKDIADYAMPLAFFVGAVALYQTILQKTTVLTFMTTDCVLNGVDCAVPYLDYFGYISMPLMSLTAFFLIIAFLWYGKSHR